MPAGLGHGSLPERNQVIRGTINAHIRTNQLGERKLPMAALTYLRQHAIATAALACAILALADISSGPSSRPSSGATIRIRPAEMTTTATVWAIVGPKGHLIAGRGDPKPAEVNRAVYAIDWGSTFQPACATVADIDLVYSPSTEKIRAHDGALVPWVAGYAVPNSFTKNGQSVTDVDTFNQTGRPTPLAFDVAVIC
jgi:hypothetical protein